jgi:hypothetical protein
MRYNLGPKSPIIFCNTIVLCRIHCIWNDTVCARSLPGGLLAGLSWLHAVSAATACWKFFSPEILNILYTIALAALYYTVSRPLLCQDAF